MYTYKVEPGAFERKEVDVVNYAFGNEYSNTTLPTFGRGV